MKSNDFVIVLKIFLTTVWKNDDRCKVENKQLCYSRVVLVNAIRKSISFFKQCIDARSLTTKEITFREKKFASNCKSFKKMFIKNTVRFDVITNTFEQIVCDRFETLTIFAQHAMRDNTALRLRKSSTNMHTTSQKRKNSLAYKIFFKNCSRIN